MLPTQRQSGTYQTQLEGYKAFIPAPLPPKPPIRQDHEFSNLLAQATLSIGRLDGAIQILPNADLFVFMYVRKEAVLSSQIEGTQSSLNDLLEAEAKLFNPNRPSDVAEVINYVDAMYYGLERLSALPVSVRLIREIHQRLMQGVRGSERNPGEIRTSQNWIGPQGAPLRRARYVPPPPHIVPDCLGDLEKFLHGETDYHELIRIGLAHAQFETIHPFLDGNGRAGRLLITFLLCEKGFLQKPVLYISNYFKTYRAEYYEKLQAIRDSGDWEGWLKFFLRGVEEASSEAAATARRILALREDHRRQVHCNFGARAGNAIRILDELFRRPVMTVNEAQALIDQTYPVANRIMTEFQALGILSETTGQRRNRVFQYTPYIDLFSESPQSTAIDQ